MAIRITPETNLGLYHRESLKSQFRADLTAGTARQLVIPLDAFGTFLLPVIYLCIPHTRRPWLYRMRFAVMALMMWLNYDMIVRASSTNMAAAYASGLAGAWGALWGVTVLIWTRPQFEAERVERRVKGMVMDSNGGAVGQNGHANGGLLHRHRNGALPRSQLADKLTAPDETVAAALTAGYEYYWQSYPSTSPLSTRLDWVLDYVLSFRGVGWSTTSISSIPSFQRPSKALSACPVDLSSVPLRTKTGYSRYRTRQSFLRNRAAHIATSYLILDICTVLMLRDPYFILGPGYSPHPLPSLLSSLHPPILSLLRGLIALLAIISALYLLFSLAQLSQFLLSHSHPTLLRACGARADLWHYPDIFGSFANVPDSGLAGFWGGWWHQTFRGAFVAPTNWLVRNGWLPRNRRHPVTRTVGATVAFVQSGMLHAAGSFSTVSKTARPWSPPLFFLGSLVGVLLQAGWHVVMGKVVSERCPLWVRRATNLIFVVGWLCATSWLFVDDLYRAGVWLYEPLPFSPLRAMGLGLPGDAAWRWDGDVLPRISVGRRWWESGIAI
ncbi:Membrane bound o-acyl transferase family domain-containing protein [Coniochaeta hoffmannii]|uniref:Membrane bound o-acyl transferase family domain-containing protein n=1 Tax=Coniochaeta hoffmannii TaxID=91930 RepID=A0AA38SIQ8_9PEZI|nr:Membrane bound o-acyl transferase family domain-containing protein [Coniochaeta hoffmannii]